MLAALFLLGAYLLFRWNPSAKGKEHIRVEPRLPKVKMWRESFVAGATHTGNVTATVGNKLVLNWHGTPTQRDGVLKMFPVIRDKLMPDVGLASFAYVTIANIHDEGMLPDNERSNIQSLAMLWRVFTTRLDDDDLVDSTTMALNFLRTTGRIQTDAEIKAAERERLTHRAPRRLPYRV
jgi:hypothetical protein